MLDFAFHLVSRFTLYLLLLILFILFIIKGKEWGDVIKRGLLSAFFARIFLVEVIRFIAPRERPFQVFNIDTLLPLKESSSLPSGHVTFLFALSTTVFLFNRKWGIMFYSFSFLMGFSRIVSGLHFPGDILVGILLGIASGLIFEVIKEKKSRN